jgi:hypothetical protein
MYLIHRRGYFEGTSCPSYMYKSAPPPQRTLESQRNAPSPFLASQILLTTMPTSKHHSKTSGHQQCHPTSQATAFLPHIATRSSAQSALKLTIWDIRGRESSTIRIGDVASRWLQREIDHVELLWVSDCSATRNDRRLMGWRAEVPGVAGE